MSRSNCDKPFYVDVGTSEVAIRCTKDGISVEGARDIGSTSDTRVGSLSQFLRVAECWWNTYCEKSPRQETDCRGNAAAMRKALEKIAHYAEDISSMDDPYGADWRICVDIARKALSAQPRNCDVGTAEERMYRYNRLREEINERYKRLGEIPPSFAFPTAFEWEDRPYEEGDAEWEKNKRRQA